MGQAVILFVRHAESTWNAIFSATRIDPGMPDPPLTERGREQAGGAIDQLAGHGVRQILASPYRRTLETARILAEGLGCGITVEPLVRERCAFSCDIGTPASVLRRQWPGLDFGPLDEIWWGGLIESDRSVAARCHAFRARLRELDGAGPVAVVSHWGFLLALTGRRFDNASVWMAERQQFLESGDQ